MSLGFAVPQRARNGRDRFHEIDWVNGLLDMRLESCRDASRAIFGSREARQRDRGKKTSAFSFILPNLSDQRESVLVRYSRPFLLQHAATADACLCV